MNWIETNQLQICASSHTSASCVAHRTTPHHAPPTFVTSNKPTPARSHPKVPFSDGLSFQLKQTWNKTVGSFSKLECTVFIDTIQYQYTKYSYTCYKRYSTVSNPPMLPDPRWAQTIPWDFGSRCRWPSRKWRTCYWEPPLSSLASMPLLQLVQVKLVEKHVFSMDFMFVALTQLNTYVIIYLRYIYIYRFQGCVVLVDLDLVMLGFVLLVIMVFIGFLMYVGLGE